MISMKVHQFARGLWADAHEVVPSNTNSSNNPLALCYKRLRPLAPKLPNSPATSSSPPPPPLPPPPPPHNNSLSPFDLKSFIRPESGPRKFDIVDKESCPQVESSSSGSSTHPGGTRWNPTQEQIGILETLYRGGMRTPNAHQIEQITAQLGKFGKIEGKNVFYWFQNHKARERQKLKRNIFVRSPSSPSIQTIPITNFHTPGDEDSTSPYKRKFRSWGFERLVEDNINNSNYKIINIINCNSSDRLLQIDDFDHDQQVRDRTLELFPLHPEGR